MFAKIGIWLAHGGAAMFAYYGFHTLLEYNSWSSTDRAIQCFIATAIFYVGGQIIAAIRGLKSDESKGGDQ